MADAGGDTIDPESEGASSPSRVDKKRSKKKKPRTVQGQGLSMRVTASADSEGDEKPSTGTTEEDSAKSTEGDLKKKNKGTDGNTKGGKAEAQVYNAAAKRPGRGLKNKSQIVKAAEQSNDKEELALIGTAEERQKLAGMGIYPLKKINPKFPKARFHCRTCQYHLDTVAFAIRHAKESGRHIQLTQSKEQEDFVRLLLPPSDEHVAALTSLITSIVEEVSLSASELEVRKVAVKSLESLILEEEPFLSLRLYGSVAAGVALKTSDVNASLLHPPEYTPSHALSRVAEIMEEKVEGLGTVTRDFECDIPAVLVTLATGDFTCRITATSYGVLTAKLLASLLDCDARARPLAIIFRYWARLCGLDAPSRGSLPPICFTVLTAYFLQQVKPLILPPVDPETEEVLLPKKKKKHQKDKEPENTSSLGSLWLQLLRFYHSEFDCARHIVCITQGKKLKKADKHMGSRRLTIDDPENTRRPLSRVAAGASVLEHLHNRLLAASRYFGVPHASSGPLFESLAELRALRNAPCPPDCPCKSHQPAPPPAGKVEQKTGDPTLGEFAADIVAQVLTASIKIVVGQGAGDAQSLSQDEDEKDKEEEHNEKDKEEEGDEKDKEEEGNEKDKEEEGDEKDEEEEESDDEEDVEVEEVETEEEEVSDKEGKKEERVDKEEEDQKQKEKGSKSHKELARVTIKKNNCLPEVVRNLKQEDFAFKFDGDTIRAGTELPQYCTACGEKDHAHDDCPTLKLPPVEPLPKWDPTWYKHLSYVLKYVYDYYRPGKDEEKNRDLVVDQLELYLQRRLTKFMDLKLFGSSRNRFGFAGSDLDICLIAQKGASPDLSVTDIERVLRRVGFVHRVFAIPTAKVPICKFSHVDSGLEGDISLSNLLAIQNTEMLRLYAGIDERVRELGYIIKVFAKTCDIGDASKGSLSSYAYVLMLLHFLQQTEPPVIPVLQELYDGKKKPVKELEGWNAWYFSDASKLDKMWTGRYNNKQDTSQLWLDFLSYFTDKKRFDMDKDVVCIRQHARLSRFDKMWMRHCIAIEDPFNLDHNLGGHLTTTMTQYILKRFIQARTLFGTPNPSLLNAGAQASAGYLFSEDTLGERKGPPVGSRNCHLCGKIGHFKSDCPTGGRGHQREHELRRGGAEADRRFINQQFDRGQHRGPSHHQHPRGPPPNPRGPPQQNPSKGPHYAQGGRRPPQQQAQVRGVMPQQQQGMAQQQRGQTRGPPQLQQQQQRSARANPQQQAYAQQQYPQSQQQGRYPQTSQVSGAGGSQTSYSQQWPGQWPALPQQQQQTWQQQQHSYQHQQSRSQAPQQQQQQQSAAQDIWRHIPQLGQITHLSTPQQQTGGGAGGNHRAAGPTQQQSFPQGQAWAATSHDRDVSVPVFNTAAPAATPGATVNRSQQQQQAPPTNDHMAPSVQQLFQHYGNMPNNAPPGFSMFSMNSAHSNPPTNQQQKPPGWLQ